MCRVRYKSKPCRYCGTAVTCFHKFDTCQNVDPGNCCPSALQEYHAGPTDRDICFTCDLNNDDRQYRQRTGDVRYQMVVPGLSKDESLARVKRWRDENTDEANLILREFLEKPDHEDAKAAGEWLLQQPYHEPSFRSHGTPEGVVLHHFHPGLRSGYFDPRRVPNVQPDSYAAYPGSANWANNDRHARRRSEDRRRMPPPPAPPTTTSAAAAAAHAAVTATTTTTGGYYAPTTAAVTTGAGQYYYSPPVTTATTTVGGGGEYYYSYDVASDQASDVASTYYSGTSAADSPASSRTSGTSSNWSGVGSSRHHGQRGGSGAGGSSSTSGSGSGSGSSHRHHHGSSGSSSSRHGSSHHHHGSGHHGSSSRHGSSRHGSRHH